MAVGKISHQTKGGSGTAFRVGPGNLVMTNAHVLLSGRPQEYRIDFTDAQGKVTSVYGDKLLAFSARAGQHNPRPDITTPPNLDFALLTIQPSQLDQVKKFGYLDLDPGGAKPGQQIYIPQHSEVNGQPVKTIVSADDTAGPQQPSRIGQVYPDDRTVKWLHSQLVQYTADTRPGGSGSPVISADSHKVVALHTGNNLNGTANGATNMSSIWQHIKRFVTADASAAEADAAIGVVGSLDKNAQAQTLKRRDSNGKYKEHSWPGLQMRSRNEHR
jgi:hypothetical protein